MRSDSVDAFYSRARREHSVPAATLDALAADPSLPRAGVGALAEALAARPDLPAGLVALVAEVRWAAPPAESAAADADPLPLGDLVDSALDAPTPREPEPVFVPAEYAAAEFAPEPSEEAANEMALAADSAAPPRRRDEPPSDVRLWIGLGVGLWALAILMWLVYIYRPFSSPPPSEKPARARR